MFTGIVEEMGKVSALHKKGECASIVIEAKKVLEDIALGDSIAVNGICLTVTAYDNCSFTADIMHETLNRSSIGEVKRGSYVNLERALRLGSRLGGHIVTGHIDGTGRICAIKRDFNAIWYHIAISSHLAAGIIQKGSVAVDGISLTVADITDTEVAVSVIPHTAANTILGKKRVGDIVNIETDCIGKYVEKLMQVQGVEQKEEKSGTNVTMSFLLEHGFM